MSGLRPVSPEAPRARGEHFINGVRVPPSLAPERLRPPPLRERRDNLRGPLRVLLAGAVAAPIAYYFSIGNPTPVSEPAAKSGLAAFASRLVASTEFPVPKEKLRPGDAEDYNTVVSSRNKLVASIDTKPAQSAALARVEAPAALPRSVPDPAPAAVRQEYVPLDNALRVILRHFLTGIARRRSRDRFLDVHQRHISLLAGSDPEQYRETQQPKLAASFHPVRCVKYLDSRVIVT